MKKYYLYEIINLTGTVEYVGLTTRPSIRLYEHLSKPVICGHGKFYKRQDIFMNVVYVYNDRKEARSQEDMLQSFWGFEPESKKRARIGRETHKPILGEENGMSKLTEAKVVKIKLLIKQGLKLLEIAKMFGVSKASISLIKQNKSWKHITI